MRSVSAVAGGLWRGRWLSWPPCGVGHVPVGVAALFLCQALDLLLAVETQRQSCLLPVRDGLAGLDIWFLLVKFAHNFSVMGFKAAVPILLLALQWHWWQRARPRA
jgi:hypothetical protein